MVHSKKTRIKIGISCGDLNGVGLEVALKTLSDARILDLCTPVIFASKAVIKDSIKHFGFQNLNVKFINDLDEIKAKAIYVHETWEDDVDIEYGTANPSLSKFTELSLRKATDLVKSQELDALVTCPINKEILQSESFQYPGHTEFLQEMDESEDSLMLMLSEQAKIGVITGHLPLKEVAANIDSDLILKKISLLNKSLKEDFNIRRPKIAILSLNPHAGDNGLLGEEESTIILPAIRQAKSIELLPFGPFPADGFFGSDNYRLYDGILAMYHDQGLIPAKSFSFGSGINFTAGLSFIRTSPDHGTAYNIAGQGIAEEGSFRNALYEAISISKNRRMNQELEANPLVTNKNRSN